MIGNYDADNRIVEDMWYLDAYSLMVYDFDTIAMMTAMTV